MTAAIDHWVIYYLFSSGWLYRAAIHRLSIESFGWAAVDFVVATIMAFTAYHRMWP